MLLEKVEETLEEGGYSYCGYRGCFDIAARKDSMLLLKVLTNVDSFQEEQANNLKIISKNLDAKSMLVGLHTRREKLADDTLYERFEIPTVNPITFGKIVVNRTFPEIYRFRGGMFVQIDSEALRKAREDSGLSQSDLAKKVGISKKSVYEHEAQKKKMNYGNAVKLEKVLKKDLIVQLDFDVGYEIAGSGPRSPFESSVSKRFHSLGFTTDSVYQSPFNMIASDDRFLVLTGAEENRKQVERSAPHIKNFADVAEKSAVVITKEEVNLDIPSISEESFANLATRDIRRLLKSW